MVQVFTILALKMPDLKRAGPFHWMAIVQETMEPGANIGSIARKHIIGVSSLIRW